MRAATSRFWALCLAGAMLLIASPAAAQPSFPQLTGRVVDQANIIPDDQEASLTQKLAQLQQASSRQLVVVTLQGLEGYDIADYGYQLGRHWGIGQSEANNGALLIIAPTERKVRIEVGYGLEPILTDALSHKIIQERILPRFRENDYPGGIVAGADAIIEQLQAPPEVAEQRALEAQQRAQSGGGEGDVSIVPLIFWGFVIVFIFIPGLFRRRGRGRRYRRGGSGLGHVLLWTALDAAASSGRSSGSGWGGGGGGWGGGGFGGGGFSGGGGSFGGGGASGSW
jgi:uncharacterized protein